MSFYNEWKKTNDLEENTRICNFLMKEYDSDTILRCGTEIEINEAVDALFNIPIEKFLIALSNLDCMKKLTPNDVPQFSNFDHSINRVPELLQFTNVGLSFYEVGYQITKAKNINACIKYGENHTKLANMVSLVNISKTRPAIVTSSSLGKYLIAYSLNEKKDLLRKLMLRNCFIQKIINMAMDDKINYFEVTNFLSETTRIRRRSNVKYLVKFILEGTMEEHYFYNINW